MNEILQFRLLGPQITLGGSVDQFCHPQSTSPLIYLASTGYPHSREKLAKPLLAWLSPDCGLKIQTILDLRQSVSPYLLLAGKDAFDGRSHWLDVEVLRKALENKAVTANTQQLWT
jgi:hypothetical protein